MTNEGTFLLACFDEKGKPHIEQHGPLSADEFRALIRAMIDHYFNHISTETEHDNSHSN
jgi:hypothetical protein